MSGDLVTQRPASAMLPAAFERACLALATCASLDECKDLADQAAALASYAAQAKDETMFQYVSQIHVRAVRRCGELLKEFPSIVGRPAVNCAAADTISQRQAAEQAGMSKRQEVTAVRIANVPAKVFETAVESDHPPTVTTLAKMGTGQRTNTPASSSSSPASEPPKFKSRAAVEHRRDQMRTMAADGHTSRQIASALGLSEAGCRDKLHKEGIDVPADRTVGKARHHDATRIVENIVMDAEHLTADVNLVDFNELNPARLVEWITSLSTSRKALDALIRRLMKEQGKHEAA